MLRVGFLALLSAMITGVLLREGPSLLPLSAWHSSLGLTSIVVLAMLVGYAFYTSLGGRPARAPAGRRIDQGEKIIDPGSSESFEPARQERIIRRTTNARP